jgi:error-prone DNA polymerase
LLRRPAAGEDVTADYRHLGFTLGPHPLALLRNHLSAMRIQDARSVAEEDPGRRVYTAGLVITRQRPASASGVMFVTLEDETGYVNLIVWEKVAERTRRALLGASLLGVVGRVQKEGVVLHVIAEQLYDHSALLGRLNDGNGLVTHSRDFH